MEIDHSCAASRASVSRGERERSNRVKADEMPCFKGEMRWVGEVGILVGRGMLRRRKQRRMGYMIMRGSDAGGCADVVDWRDMVEGISEECGAFRFWSFDRAQSSFVLRLIVHLMHWPSNGDVGCDIYAELR